VEIQKKKIIFLYQDKLLIIKIFKLKTMKKTLLIASILLTISFVNAQSSSFNEESQVISYMNGKTFYNSDSGLEIEYGYISSYNTYGIKIKNKNDVKFYFINVNIDAFGSYADLYGMSAENGSNFGFRLFKSKLVVGYGEENESTYYLK
jgi:hypothetical protein